MKKIIVFSAAAMMAAVIAVCIYVQNNHSANSVRFFFKAENGAEQSVELYYDDGMYYAFLPSYADFDTMRVQFNGGRLYLDGKRYGAGSSFSDLKTDEVYTLEIRNLLGASVKKPLVFMQSENVPSLFITLSSSTLGEINADKTVSAAGCATIVNADQTVAFSGMFKALHGRGNTTWYRAKKPYTLRFAQNVSLLGMPAGTGWVLLSNTFDESGLRNKLAYDTAKALGVEFAVDSRYVDLYIDQQYLGLYLLTEKVEVGENRVEIRDLSAYTQAVNYEPLSSYAPYEETENGKIKRGYSIPNDPDDISGGYLLQAEWHADQIESEECLFQTDTMSFTVSHPGFASKKQIDYISALVNETEKALQNGDAAGIDLDSFVKYYLVQELFANSDNSSAYIYKNSDAQDGRLHACCIWDFDLTVGNCWSCFGWPPDVLYQREYNWFPYLYQNDAFFARLAETYRQFVKADPNGLLYDKLEEYKSEINASFLMNKRRWKSADAADDETGSSQQRFDTLDQHVDFIRDYMQKRLAFLDAVWIDNVEYCSVSFSAYEDTVVFSKWYSLKPGETLGEAPVPPAPANGNRFAGWFDESGVAYVPGRAITQNERYTAKWEAVGDSRRSEGS